MPEPYVVHAISKNQVQIIEITSDRILRHLVDHLLQVYGVWFSVMPVPGGWEVTTRDEVDLSFYRGPTNG